MQNYLELSGGGVTFAEKYVLSCILTLRDMKDDKEKSPEMLSRRAFFRKTAQAALPILGAIALAGNPAIAKAVESSSPADAEEMGCSYGCQNGCSTSCYTTCRMMCAGSCKGSCQGQCTGACARSCSGGCQMGCKGYY